MSVLFAFHPVLLTASSPSYFRGFTIIAQREGAEGDRDEDYIGNFQVRWQLLKRLACAILVFFPSAITWELINLFTIVT